MSLFSMLDRTVTLQRGTAAQDGEGNERITFADTATVRAGVQRTHGQAVLTDGGWAREERWLAFLMPEVDVAIKDRLIDGAATYEVVSIETPRGSHHEVRLRSVAP